MIGNRKQQSTVLHRFVSFVKRRYIDRSIIGALYSTEERTY